MPERPSTKAAQVVGTSLPTGVRAPRPVTTTLVLFFGKGTPPGHFFTLFEEFLALIHFEFGAPALAAWGSHLSPKVRKRETLYKLYNTKRAKEIRLALREFIIPGVRRTLKFRPGGFENHCQRGQKLVEIAYYAGLASRRPFLATTMAIFMLSLAGVPPLAGFMGKFYLFSAAVQADLTWLAIIGVLNSVLSAFFYLRVIVVMYMREAEEPKPLSPSWPLGVAVALAALGTLALGLWPSPLLGIAQQAIGALLGT